MGKKSDSLGWESKSEPWESFSRLWCLPDRVGNRVDYLEKGNPYPRNRFIYPGK